MMKDGNKKMLKHIIKKTGQLLVISLLLVSGCTITAYANSGILDTDNANVYSGMAKSYAAGYQPTVADAKPSLFCLGSIARAR